MKGRVVEIPMAFYSCHIKMPDLANMAIAASRAIDYKGWGQKRNHHRKLAQAIHPFGNQEDPDDLLHIDADLVEETDEGNL